MKAVLALLIVCLVQISFAEQENVADDASSVANLLLQREVREAGRGCEKGDRKCEKKEKNTSNKKRKSKKRSKKGKKVSKKEEGLNGARSSSANGSGRNTTGQCFTDMVAKTKKFNKAQVEFRLAKRIESWGKLMKNKKE